MALQARSIHSAVVLGKDREHHILGGSILGRQFGKAALIEHCLLPCRGELTRASDFSAALRSDQILFAEAGADLEAWRVGSVDSAGESAAVRRRNLPAGLE